VDLAKARHGVVVVSLRNTYSGFRSEVLPSAGHRILRLSVHQRLTLFVLARAGGCHWRKLTFFFGSETVILSYRIPGDSTLGVVCKGMQVISGVRLASRGCF